MLRWTTFVWREKERPNFFLCPLFDLHTIKTKRGGERHRFLIAIYKQRGHASCYLKSCSVPPHFTAWSHTWRFKQVSSKDLKAKRSFRVSPSNSMHLHTIPQFPPPLRSSLTHSERRAEPSQALSLLPLINPTPSSPPITRFHSLWSTHFHIPHIWNVCLMDSLFSPPRPSSFLPSFILSNALDWAPFRFGASTSTPHSDLFFFILISTWKTKHFFVLKTSIFSLFLTFQRINSNRFSDCRKHAFSFPHFFPSAKWTEKKTPKQNKRWLDWFKPIVFNETTHLSATTLFSTVMF